jgi:hypothetical protein
MFLCYNTFTLVKSYDFTSTRCSHTGAAQSALPLLLLVGAPVPPLPLLLLLALQPPVMGTPF